MKTPVLIRAGAIVVDSRRVLRKRILRIERGRITALEPDRGQKVDWDFAETVLIPGLVNAHTHLELSTTKVSPPPSGRIAPWIEKLLSQKAKQKEGAPEKAIRCGLQLCLQSGTTTVADIASLGINPEVFRESKLRALVFWEFLGLDPEIAKTRWAQALYSLRQKQTAQLRFGLSPHAPYSVSERLFRSFAAHLHRSQTQAALHFAESRAELEFLRWGKGDLFDFLNSLQKIPNSWKPPQQAPLTWLQSRRAMHHRCMLIHGNYLEDAQIRELAQKRVSVVYCPGSHHFFRHERYPLRSYLRSGVNLALGTDSLASNQSLSLFREMKLVRKSFPWVSARQVFQMATQNGAKALGWQNEIGSLEIGKLADFVVLDLDHSESDQEIYEQITEGEPGVLTSFIGGKLALRPKKGVL